jgi:hypothetical protein
MGMFLGYCGRGFRRGSGILMRRLLVPEVLVCDKHDAESFILDLHRQVPFFDVVQPRFY